LAYSSNNKNKTKQRAPREHRSNDTFFDSRIETVQIETGKKRHPPIFDWIYEKASAYFFRNPRLSA